MHDSISSQAAAWVEAFGAIIAIVGAAWVSSGESRASRQRDERSRKDAEDKDARALIATKTAALNLAILAATEIHSLHILLRKEEWRSRVGRV